MGQKKSLKIFDKLAQKGAKAKKAVTKQAGAFADQAKDVATGAVDKAGDVKKGVERFLYRPVFPKTLEKSISKIIRITEHDTLRESSPACKKSVGFKDIVKGKTVLNIYSRYTDKTGIQFYPISSEGLYIADPYSKNTYVAYENYYSYLKEAKVSELTEIAQYLGAKHIKITWEEEEKTLTNKEKKVKESAKASGQGSVAGSYNHSDEERTSKKTKILFESYYPGSAPIEPKLKYFKSVSQINNLIKGRLNPKNQLKHQELILEQQSTCGIKMNDAVTVDAAIKKYDIATGKSAISFKTQTEREYKSSFRYIVEF